MLNSRRGCGAATVKQTFFFLEMADLDRTFFSGDDRDEINYRREDHRPGNNGC